MNYFHLNARIPNAQCQDDKYIQHLSEYIISLT